jgi:hypothetical protein
VEPDRQALAAAAIGAAIERIEGMKGPARRFVVPHRIVLRGSVESPPAASEGKAVVNTSGAEHDQPTLSEQDRAGIVEALVGWRIASFPSRETALKLGFNGVGGLIERTAALAELIGKGVPLSTLDWELVRDAVAGILEDRLHHAAIVDDPAGPFPTADVTTALTNLDSYLPKSGATARTPQTKRAR